MTDPAPADAMGLVAVSLPDTGEWQAFPVLPGYKEHAERVLREIRAANREQGATEVRRTEGAYGDEERTVGGLCGTLAQVFATSHTEPRSEGAHSRALMTTIQAVAYALHSVTGERYLLITGKRAQGRPGFYSNLRRIEAATMDEAREKIAAEIDRARHTSTLTEKLTGGLLDPTRLRRPES